MFKKATLVLISMLAVLLAVIVTRPNTFHVERSALLAAPPAVAFSLVNDFHQWGAWSPWEKLDPSMKKTHEGPTAGVGASYFWSGNDKVGEGRMTVTESQLPERIVIKLEFIKPWQALNTTTFTFSPQGEATQVRWAMDGTNNFMAKAFGLIMNMDDLIGKDFEKGLAAMKTTAEAEAKRQALARAAVPNPAPPEKAPEATANP